MADTWQFVYFPEAGHLGIGIKETILRIAENNSNCTLYKVWFTHLIEKTFGVNISTNLAVRGIIEEYTMLRTYPSPF